MSLKLQLHTSQGYGDTHTHTDTCTHFSTSRPNYRSSITEWLHVHHHYGDFGSNVSAPQVAPRIEQRRRERFYRAVILSNTPTPTPSHTLPLPPLPPPFHKVRYLSFFFLWRSLTGGCRPTSTTPWGERGSTRRRRHSGPAHSVCVCE